MAQPLATALGQHSTESVFNVKQTRARSQLSCTHCRRGKLKCDRNSPCNQCIKRSREDSCGYLPPAKKSRTGQNVKNRIQHLEKLVVDLMNSSPPDDSKGSPSAGNLSALDHGRDGVNRASAVSNALTPPQDVDDTPYPALESSGEPIDAALGRMRISKKETRYVAEGHWSALLDTISAVKEDLAGSDEEGDGGLEDEDEVDINDESPPGISNLLRSPVRRSKAELLALLPPRAQVDRLVYQWFNAPDPFKAIIHPPTFQEEYLRFWQDPTGTPTMWIGLLYGLLSLSASFPYHQHSEPSSPEARQILADSIRFHELSASAIALADFSTPKAYTIEALQLYVGGLLTVNSFVDIWQLLGLIIRLAMRMGYHRDPSHFPNLPVYEQEMRRRVWWNTYMADVLVSSQLGLPSMSRSIPSDTQPPRNLSDGDLSPRMSTLPPARPPDELTPISYSCAKIDLCRVFAAVSEQIENISPRSFEQTMILDNQLEAAHANIPTRIKIRPFDQYIADRTETIMWSFNLELLYLKTRIVLHRPFMKSHPSDPAATLSRQKCIDSAMRILRHHHEIYLASQQGGQLAFARQYMGSITTNDFLLASMILCLELSQHLDNIKQNNSDFTLADPGDQTTDHQEMIELLRITHSIWARDEDDKRNPSLARGTPSDTKKGSRALGAMLRRAEALSPEMGSMTFSSTDWSGGKVEGTRSPRRADHDAAATQYAEDPPSVDMLRFGPSRNVMPWNRSVATPGVDDLTMIDDMINAGTDIDWGMWDQAVGAPANIMDDTAWALDPTIMSDLTAPAFAFGDLSQMS